LHFSSLRTLRPPAPSLFPLHDALPILAERGDVVAATKIRVQYIALDIIKAIAYAELLCGSFGCRNHSCPIDCGHPHPRRFLGERDRKSTRLNSSHDQISYAVFCLKKKK